MLTHAVLSAARSTTVRAIACVLPLAVVTGVALAGFVPRHPASSSTSTIEASIEEPGRLGCGALARPATSIRRARSV